MQNYLVRKRILVFILILGMITGLNSCFYDVEEELYPPIDCVTENVTYNAVVLPIIRTNCYVCHAAAANLGNVTLEGYAKIKPYIDNGKLLGSIKHQSGFVPMPDNLPKLLDCDISKVEAWVTAGAKNN